MSNYKKVSFENFVRTDNGEYFRIYGWYAQNNPSVYEQHVENITGCFEDMA